ncbi:MAG: 3-deoxy-7-phosphoheptulonate synthase [Spirochaetales bacterium]
MARTDDIRIESLVPLIPPRELKEAIPAGSTREATVARGRAEIEAVLSGADDRLLVIVGPCSIHDPQAAREYAERLAEIREALSDNLLIVMRVYFEKPRTRLGWRGLVLDPNLDGTYDISTGLRTARELLGFLADIGMPAGSEVLDPIVPQYTADLMSWASIGARTTESQTHRDMASGLSMPVGYKNGTDGNVDTAVNAMASSMHPHSFIGIDQEGRTCVLNTTGNPSGHLILRGGRSGPNYDAGHVASAADVLAKAGLPGQLVIDCSHGNSRKDPARQRLVLEDVLRQRAEGTRAVRGVMIESNLHPGRQEVGPKETLSYGVSITDACIGWEETEAILRSAAESEQSRR